MKPPPFRYVAPRSLDEVHAYLAQFGFEAKLLAGGQSLIPAMNFRLARPGVLIDLNTVPGLNHITDGSDDVIHIGAMVRQRAVERSELVSSKVPILAAAMPLIAHTQIRNRGTVGGSLAHADPAAELPAVMVALGANLRVSSRSGERMVTAVDFYQGLFTIDLAADELLLDIEVPILQPRTGWSIREVVRRHGDYAMAGVAVRVELDDTDRCVKLCLVYFGVGEGPARAAQAEEMARGEKLTDDLIESIARAAVEQDLDPHEDIHASSTYRSHLARILGRDAIKEAHARANSTLTTYS